MCGDQLRQAHALSGKLIFCVVHPHVYSVLFLNGVGLCPITGGPVHFQLLPSHCGAYPAADANVGHFLIGWRVRCFDHSLVVHFYFFAKRTQLGHYIEGNIFQPVGGLRK